MIIEVNIKIDPEQIAALYKLRDNYVHASEDLVPLSDIYRIVASFLENHANSMDDNNEIVRKGIPLSADVTVKI